MGVAKQGRRPALLSGAAGGLAAAFNTPLSAITFVLEEIIEGTELTLSATFHLDHSLLYRVAQSRRWQIFLRSLPAVPIAHWNNCVRSILTSNILDTGWPTDWSDRSKQGPRYSIARYCGRAGGGYSSRLNHQGSRGKNGREFNELTRGLDERRNHSDWNCNASRCPPIATPAIGCGFALVGSQGRSRCLDGNEIDRVIEQTR